MGLTNSQYDAIIREYNKRQFQDKRDQDRRVAEVYAALPQIKEMDDSISSIAVACARQLLDGDETALGRLRAEVEDLREQKRLLLSSKGFSEDYMEMRYVCPDCRDTGYIDGRKCHCFRQAEMDLLYTQSNIREIIKKENFDTFSYDYFEKQQIHPQAGKPLWNYMHEVVDRCWHFIDGFGDGSGNLLLTGTTGVGKTFLTNCIARELIDRCCSVIYLSATELFDIFSHNKFDYHAAEVVGDQYQYILESDLLIIDDLGTELTNTFTTSQLFYCINERLIRKKSTIISTNLSVNMLRDFYSERVTSRIMSHYQVIPLYGEDIRIQKKLRGIQTR